MRAYLLLFAVAGSVTYLLTVVAREIALRLGAVAKVRDRDVHDEPIPYMGGVAMLGGLAAAYLVARQLPFLSKSQFVLHDAGVVLGAGALICLIGILDDILELDALTKLGGQLLATAVLIYFNVQYIFFTVQFMWDRLPLYIVAFYPALAQLAYELVRVLGVFRRGPLAGSIAVAFVCQVFYEVFDQLGPQLKWWAWNDANRQVNHPMFASVPMSSMVLFASVSFGVLTYLTVRLTAGRRGWSLGWRVVLAGLLAPPSMGLAGIPSGLFGSNVTAQAWVLGAELVLIWIAGLWVLLTTVRRGPVAESDPRFARLYPAAYLVVLAGLWVSALPAYLDAVHGTTTSGTPIGSGPYALACFIAATALIVAVLRRRGAAPAVASPEVALPEVA